MLQEKTKAPDFTLQSANGLDINLSDFTGKKVILYFYPRDNTPGCTVEACEFRDAYEEYQNAGAVIIGISPDTVSKHKSFSGQYDLPFVLLADTEKEVIKAYGSEKVTQADGKTIMGIQRSTFVIDEEGTIVKVFPKVTPAGHAKEILRFIDGI
jgi:thioredoxin-dependent peroxiredoxin